jgi:hypothetical protein
MHHVTRSTLDCKQARLGQRSATAALPIARGESSLVLSGIDIFLPIRQTCDFVFQKRLPGNSGERRAIRSDRQAPTAGTGDNLLIKHDSPKERGF